MISLNSFRPEVVEYYNTLIEQLKAQYGVVRPEWEISINMLLRSYQVYMDCYDQIKIDGLMITNNKGNKEKHPLVPSMLNAQAAISRISNQFCLNILSASKLRPVDQPDTSDDYIDSLCN